MTVKTQIVMKRNAFKNNMKRFNDDFIRGEREEMEKLAGILADGYNAIVSGWEEAPRFTGTARYYPQSKRFFVRVQIVGSEELIGRFNAIDFGLTRSTKADVKGKEAPNKVTVKGIQYPVLKRPLPIPQGAQLTENQYAQSKGRNIHKMKKSEYDAFLVDYGNYVKNLIAKYTVKIGARGQAISKFEGRDKRMPMRPYKSRTGKGGRIGGPGTYYPAEKVPGGSEWKAIPYLYQVTLGDIEARNFTLGLYSILKRGNDSFGMGKIWPRARLFSLHVRSGWYRGTKYYEQGTKS